MSKRSKTSQGEKPPSSKPKIDASSIRIGGKTLSVEDVRILMARAELKRRQREEKAEFYSPIVPHGMAFHQSEAKRVLAHGGNRGGKSRAAAQEVYWRCIGKHPYKKVPEPPVYWRACGPGMEQQVEKVIVEYFRNMIPARYLAGGSFDSAYSQKLHMIKFADRIGSWIELMSFDQDPSKGSGRALHGAWLDEVHVCPRLFWLQTAARLVDYDGVAILTTCPEHGFTWDFEFYEKARAGDQNYACFSFPTRANPFLPPEAIDRLEEDIGGDEVQRRIRLFGDYVAIGGLIYNMLDPKIHRKTAHEVGMGDDWTRYVTIDPGIAKDHRIMWVAVGPGGHYHFYRRLSMSGPIPAVAREIRAQSGLERIADFRIDGHWDWDNRVATSSSGQGSLNVQQEFLDAGLPVVKAPLDIRRWLGVDKVKAMLRPDFQGRSLITFEPDMDDVWYEMTHYQIVPPRKEDPDRHNPKIRKVDDDYPDCVRIAVTSDLSYQGVRGGGGVLYSLVEQDEYGLVW